MPATMRVKVEPMVQAIPSRSLVPWLDDVANLLDRQRPARKRGAPPSITQAFVSRVAATETGAPYIGRGGRVDSRFQRFCRAALSAVGDPRRISARQVANYKRSSQNDRLIG